MGGVVVHLLSGILFSFLLFKKGFRRELIYAGFVGTLIPDLFYLIIAIYRMDFNFLYTISLPFWELVKEINHWRLALTTSFVVAGIGLLLYESHVINKENFWEIEDIDKYFFLGIIIHIVIDILIPNASVLI